MIILSPAIQPVDYEEKNPYSLLSFWAPCRHSEQREESIFIVVILSNAKNPFNTELWHFQTLDCFVPRNDHVALYVASSGIALLCSQWPRSFVRGKQWDCFAMLTMTELASFWATRRIYLHQISISKHWILHKFKMTWWTGSTWRG